MSDLSNSCEYITFEKTCLAVIEKQKAQRSRQLFCLNDEKLTCCYVCDYRHECTISCKYLGNTDNSTKQTDIPQPEPPNKLENEVNPPKDILIVCCSECKVEMTLKKIKLYIDVDTSRQTDEVLRLNAYLCPYCGRIELRAK